MRRGFQGRSPQRNDAGVTLLEVLIAISILGIGFASIFSGFSAALRTVEHVDHYAQVTDFAANKLNELEIDPSLEAGEDLSGASDSGLSWQATTDVVDQRPGADPDHPIQLVRIKLRVSWKTSHGEQFFDLETLKVVPPKAEEGS
jgi:prepilin-type N-terminal cleavage/methylation domain-containing protein